MQPLTTGRAKPVLPYGGIYRLVDFPLSNAVHSRLSDVWVLEQFQPHSLNEHLVNGRPWDLDRNYGGLRLIPPSKGGEGQGWAEGNADAIQRNAHLIRDFAPDVVVVASADHVYRLDYRDVIDAHHAHDAAVTAVTTVLPVGESASRYGVVRAGADGRITSFAYKPEHPESRTVTTELFVYDARALLDTLDELANEGDEDDGGLKDFGHKLLPRLVAAGGAYAVPLSGYWRDVGVVESYWASHMDLLAPAPPFRLDDPAWPILTLGAQRMPARIDRTAEIDASLVSPGCEVRGRVTRSVLGPGVLVEEGAEVSDAVLFHDAVVRRGAHVTRAVLDSEVEVGRGARVGAPAAANAPAAEGIAGGRPLRPPRPRQRDAPRRPPRPRPRPARHDPRAAPADGVRARAAAGGRGAARRMSGGSRRCRRDG
jgi:glucose-1-phosphate adenylyltransferase